MNHSSDRHQEEGHDAALHGEICTAIITCNHLYMYYTNTSLKVKAAVPCAYTVHTRMHVYINGSIHTYMTHHFVHNISAKDRKGAIGLQYHFF